jgi:Mg-chelatase subunit ChlD
MIPDLPTDPRRALEASLTALLLGELPPEQAEFLQRIVAQDTELKMQFERLKQTIELVRETGLGTREPSVVLLPAPKLSEERRQELLRRFKPVAHKEFGGPPWRQMNWLMPTAVAACIVALLGVSLSGVFSSGPASTRRLLLSGPLGRNERAAADAEQLRRPALDDAAREKAVHRGAVISLPTGGVAGRAQTTTIVLPTQRESAALTLSETEVPNQAWHISASGRAFDALGASTDRSGGGGIGGVPSSQGNFSLNGIQPPEQPRQEVNLQTASGSGIGGVAALDSKDVSANREVQQLAQQTKIPVLGNSPILGTQFSQDLRLLPETNGFGGGGYGGYSSATSVADASSEQLAKEKLSEKAVRKAGSSVTPALASEPPSPEASAALARRYGLMTRSDEQKEAGAKSAKEDAGQLSLDQTNFLALGDSSNDGFITTFSPGPGLLPPSAAPLLSYAEPQSAGEARSNGDSSKLLEAGKELLKRGRPEEAETQLAEAAKKDPRNQAAYYYLNLAKEAEMKQIAGNDTSVKSLEVVGLTDTLGQGVSLASKARDNLQANGSVLGRRNLSEKDSQQDVTPAKPAAPLPVPQPEVLVRANAFSTFSLNVSDVSFKLAAASLEKGLMPEAASIRSEEFINAFDYRDPEPAPGVPIAFAYERARYPFTQNRDLLRFAIQTAASGRQAGRPLNVVLLLDNSGSMERADRVAIIREALRVLATQLQSQDTLSVVTFARTARLWVDGVPGTQAGQVAEQISGLTPQGGTNLEEAMNLAYQTALRHYMGNGMNRVVLLTDGAANLGDIDPDALKRKAETYRKQGVALDCFGIGWEGYNDDLLEVLARNSDGRYGFINTPEEAATEFAGQLAGALQVAASDLKVQVEFNPNRVTAFRQIGYTKHQLTKEQFRDNTVNAAQLGAAESGNALYVIDCNAGGQGAIATVRVRYRVPGTSDYREQAWDVSYTGTATPLEQASPAMRLAASAGAFAEWLASSPYAAEVTPDTLLGYTRGVPEAYGADPRPKRLEWMIRQAKSISGK